MIGGIKMFKGNKKGFTLVELLAVIVILAVILAIAVPSISSMMNNAKKAAFEDNVKLIIRGIDYKVLECQSSGAAGCMPTTGTKATTELANYGANSADYSAFSIIAVYPDPTEISLTGATSGKFGACTVTNATLINVDQTGADDGTITGC
jgi:type IV pilus assembly protein PilA